MGRTAAERQGRLSDAGSPCGPGGTRYRRGRRHCHFRGFRACPPIRSSGSSDPIICQADPSIKLARAGRVRRDGLSQACLAQLATSLPPRSRRGVPNGSTVP
eukprot:215799-Hanusia_phi.AAC.1